MSAFVELLLKDHMVVHGYDADNCEIVETVTAETASRKIVAVSRIKSVSEKYILTDYGYGRLIYWEHLDGFEVIAEKLAKAGLLIR
jgi:hypothetical protein